LVVVFWCVNWQPERFDNPTLWAFFWLWLGYILVVDGLVELRSGTSLYRRSRAGWVGLFVVSMPGWWLFEALNKWTHNWEYLGTGHLSRMEYIFWASVSFSTVMPAVFETAELLRTAWPANGGRRAERPSALSLAAIAALGVGLLAGIYAAPRWFYPALWISVLLIIDPWNWARGWPSILGWARGGRWGPVVRLAAAALVCGFFWELWNIRSFPKWIYHIPVFGPGEALAFPKLFEMPLPGYLGYLPFGLELFALYVAVAGVAGSRHGFLRV
jgi:hypothetical protein